MNFYESTLAVHIFKNFSWTIPANTPLLFSGMQTMKISNLLQTTCIGKSIFYIKILLLDGDHLKSTNYVSQHCDALCKAHYSGVPNKSVGKLTCRQTLLFITYPFIWHYRGKYFSKKGKFFPKAQNFCHNKSL